MGAGVNVLMVGGGKAGSWQMRGEQLGTAMGARVTSTPSDQDWAWADVVVIVKRAIRTFAATAHAHGVPIVWDALDFWQQPAQNGVTEAEALALLRSQIRAYEPALVIGATEAMALAANGVCVPHHGHQGLQPTDAREDCRVVGYEGNARYLDGWEPYLRTACARRGWSFVVNPPDLSACDILVALRVGIWDGWICRQWKSGVKIVNAILAGRPIITQDAAAVSDIWPTVWRVETVNDVNEQFDYWAAVDRRQAVVDECRTLAPDFSLDALARQYLGHIRAACEVNA